MEGAGGFEEFVAIVDTGSVTGAAEVLGLPRPTVSRRLARLEERLGVRLLHRTTRRITVTPEGELLYLRARRVVEMAREAESAIRRLDGVPRGLLRFSAPSEIPRGPVAGWLGEFVLRYPEVELEVVADNRHVDLVADGFDVALRRGTIEDTSLVARTLVVNEIVAVASPSYLSSAGTPQQLEDLAQHECLVDYRSGLRPHSGFPLCDGGTVDVSGRFKSNLMMLRLEAAKQGLGIALAPERTVAEDLERGELVRVLPGLVGERERVCLVYAEREFIDPKVRCFVDFFAEKVRGRS